MIIEISKQDLDLDISEDTNTPMKRLVKTRDKKRDLIEEVIELENNGIEEVENFSQESDFLKSKPIRAKNKRKKVKGKTYISLSKTDFNMTITIHATKKVVQSV